MAEPEEERFQVVDKRRVTREEKQPETPAAAAEAVETDEPEATEAAGAEQGFAEATGPDQAEEPGDQDEPAMGPTNAVDLVQMCLGMLNEIAWVKMGLVPDPMTGAIGPDLNQARLAIDCAADLAHRLEAHVDGRTKRELDVLVQNLKMNFVQRSVGGGA